MRFPRAICFFVGFGLAFAALPSSRAQAALLMENADGISRVFDHTGHEALYFARICAASGFTSTFCCAARKAATSSGVADSLSTSLKNRDGAEDEKTISARELFPDGGGFAERYARNG